MRDIDLAFRMLKVHEEILREQGKEIEKIKEEFLRPPKPNKDSVWIDGYWSMGGT